MFGGATVTDIIWTNTTIKLSQLQPWEGNPKTSTAKNAEQLKYSVEELGQFQDVAIGPFNGNGKAPVYDGHQRLNAWFHAYGLDYQVTAKQSSRPLTEQERRKVAIYSRQIGAWDWDTLSSWDTAELMNGGFDEDLLKDWGQDYSNLAGMIEAEKDADWGAFDNLPDEDRAPFQQMTFTLHDSQVETIKEAAQLAKSMGAFDSPNENSNGNALARICETYITDYGNG